jgi:hypothetical protein
MPFEIKSSWETASEKDRAAIAECGEDHKKFINNGKMARNSTRNTGRSCKKSE